jgi:hypothetical protein
MDTNDPARGTLRLTRRQMLGLAGGAAATGLLVASGVAHADVRQVKAQRMADAVAAVVTVAPVRRMAPLASFQQAAQTGFTQINGGLTFGPPADIAAGWDGTLWAIDTTGAPHLYNPLGDTWALHGSGVDAVAHNQEQATTLYFRGPQVFVSGGSGGVYPIAQLWPQLPPSYQLSVQGAAWAAAQLWLFRGGTYLSVAWPTLPTAAVYHAAMQPVASPSATPTPTHAPTASGTPTVHPSGSPTANGTPTVMGTPTANGTPTVMGTPTANGTPTVNGTPTANETPTVNGTPTPGSTPVVAGTATAAVGTPGLQPAGTATASGTPVATGTPSASPTVDPPGTPTVNGTPTATALPSRELSSTPNPVANRLESLAGWPQTGAWQGGLIDGVYTAGESVIFVMRGGEFLTLDFASGGFGVDGTPQPLSELDVASQAPAEWQADGFDGYLVVGGKRHFLRGAQAITYDSNSGTTDSHYIATEEPDWPLSWNPILRQAPSGRATGLWAVTPQGEVMSFDGTQWTWQQVTNLTTVGVGVDGSLFAVDWNDQTQLLQWNGSSWNNVATHNTFLSQVSVGNQGLVWTRDNSNAVHQLNQGQLQPVQVVGQATHLAASHDGTLWSCNGSDPVAARFASDLGVPPANVVAPGAVQKVASTAFGVVHCLVGTGEQATIQHYQSPYMFRTAGSYTVAYGDALEQGLGSIFVTAELTGLSGSQGTQSYCVVALDAHTGQELSRSATAPTNVPYTSPVFDPIHETVIVGLTGIPGDASHPGQLLGLNARNLSQVLWTITLPDDPNTNSPRLLGPGRPTLLGTQLCVSDNFNTLIMYDTGQASTATPSSTPVWTYTFGSAPQDEHRLPPPVIANGQVYAAWWLYSKSFGFVQLWLWTLDAATGQGTQTNVDAAANPNNPYRTMAQPSDWSQMGHFAPVLVGGVLYVNGSGSVAGIDVNANSVTYYDLPGNAAFVTSGFGAANGVVWFGDNGGNLYGVNSQMKIVPNTPQPVGNQQQITTTPVAYTDSQGQSAVLLSLADQNATQPGLLAFDPTSGNVATLPTQGTAFIGLTRSVSNGVVYGGGVAAAGTNPGVPAAQIFAIRVDAALQGLRDVVVDSQLMQDFDDPSQPTHNPNGVARYQTHLTLIDDQKAPMARQAVKLWSDQANTTLLVNGQSYTIGPDDDQYAVVNTGADGTLLIVSGYTQANGSDTPDMSAPPLRAWASFMDPYERMLIYRDREFHNRISAAHATDPSQAGADDPTRPNLQTAQKYGDLQNQGKTPSSQTSLFTDAEKSQGQPQNVANAIQQMTSSVGTAPPAGSKTLKAAFAVKASATSGKYVAYADTPGAVYSPVNVAANRAAVVVKPAGLSYSSNSAGTAASAYSSMTPAEATLAIDALDGVPWHTSQYATPRVKSAVTLGAVNLNDALDDFWNWIKGAVATITHVIVSVAEDIYAGIRFIINGVAHVFQAIITGIEQIASAIGSFFIELGKLIEEVIEALSVLFQFGHIIDTHNILKAELLNRINGVSGNADYPGLANLVKSSVLPPVNNFFATAEQNVTDALNKMANALGTSSSGAFPGGGSTVHSAFTATPRAGGASSSTATQGMWGLQKLNAGVGAGGGAAPTALVSRQLLGADPIGDFFGSFFNSLSSDPTLNSQWAKVRSGAQSLDNTGSASDFLKQGLAELLNILALLVDGVLAVSKGLVNGLLGIIDDLIQTMFDPNTGVLTAPLEIPVLSWLYQLLFGEPLTILNALMLVIAIPVTIIWRIIEGQWPADSGLMSASPGALLGAAPAATQRLLAIWNMLVSIVLGIIYGVGDAAGAGDVPLIIGRVALLLSVTSAAISTPSVSSDAPGELLWVSWGVTLSMALLNILGAVDMSDALAQYESLGRLGPALLSGLSIAQLLVLGLQWDPDYGVAPTNPVGDAALGISMVSALPGVINPLKLESEVGALVVSVLDVVMGIAAGVGGVMSAYSST